MDIICGLDEAGRGPLAGPVSGACVVLSSDFPMEILNDSKKMSEKKREQSKKIIEEKALAYSQVFISEKEIDEINILQASLKAMKIASLNVLEILKEKKIKIDSIKFLVDGNKKIDIDYPCEAIVKGDSKIHEIMAASILAKVARDNYMTEIAVKYPQWQFEKHKGYPTKLHRDLCKKYGRSAIHRVSFKIS